MVVCLHEYTNDGISVDQECDFARLHMYTFQEKFTFQSEAQAFSKIDMVSDNTLAHNMSTNMSRKLDIRSTQMLTAQRCT